MSETNEPTQVPDPQAAEPDAEIAASGNPDQPSWRPADYYAAPPAAPRLPRWAAISCGVAALLAIVVMFAVGSFLRSGGFATFVALAIGQFQGEMKTMFDESVTVESKERLDGALRDVRDRLRAGPIDQRDVVPLLEEIRKVGKDGRVSVEEADDLLSLLDGLDASGRVAPVD